MWLILQSAVNVKWSIFLSENSCVLSLNMQLSTYYMCDTLWTMYFLGFSGFLVRDDYEDSATFTYNNTLESRFEPLLLLGGSIDELDIPEDSVRHTSWSSAVCFHQYHVTGRCCYLEGYNSLWLPSGELTYVSTDSYNYMRLLLVFVGDFLFRRVTTVP